MTRDNVYLSIIIPAYNEEKRIFLTLQKIEDYLKNKDYNHQIIVVDDGSNDNTVQIVQGLQKDYSSLKLLKNEKNYGKGYSVRKGVLQATGDYILFSDADLSTPIEELEKLLAVLQEGYDIAIGSRALSDSQIKVRQPFPREMMGRLFNLLVSALTVKGINDTQCGFKMFKQSVAQQIFPKQTIYGFAFDVEILYLAQRLKFKIKEVPIVWINSPDSKVNPIRDSFQMFKDLLKIRFKRGKLTN